MGHLLPRDLAAYAVGKALEAPRHGPGRGADIAGAPELARAAGQRLDGHHGEPGESGRRVRDRARRLGRHPHPEGGLHGHPVDRPATSAPARPTPHLPRAAALRGRGRRPVLRAHGRHRDVLGPDPPQAVLHPRRGVGLREIVAPEHRPAAAGARRIPRRRMPLRGRSIRQAAQRHPRRTLPAVESSRRACAGRGARRLPPGPRRRIESQLARLHRPVRGVIRHGQGHGAKVVLRGPPGRARSGPVPARAGHPQRLLRLALERLP